MNAARKLIAIAAMTIALLGVAPAAGASAAEHQPAVDRTAAVTIVHSDNSTPIGHNDYTTLTPASTAKVTSDTCKQDPTQCLPYMRWNGASMSLHGRFDGFGQVFSANFAQRSQIASMLMSFGNGVFQIGANLVNFAQSLKIVETFGRTADSVTASIGQALINSPLALGAIVIGIALAFLGLRRGIPPWKRLTSALMIYGTLAILIGGSIQTTRMDSGFGIGSPGWLANGTNMTVSTLLDNTAAQITDAQKSAASVAKYGDCAVYVQNMEAEAEAASAAAPAEAKITETQKNLNLAWEQTGLQAFKSAQYKNVQIVAPAKATDSGETFGDEVYCRQLDMASGIPANEQMNLFFSWNVPTGVKSDPSLSFVRDAAVWGNTNSNPDLDRTLVGIAACQYNPSAGDSFTIRPGFTNADNAKGANTSDCKDIYTQKDKTADPFNFDSSDSDVTNAYNRDQGTPQAAAAAQSFLLTLHGGANSGADGTYALAMWALSALLYAAVLIVIAIVTLFAKFACVAMIFSVVFAAIAWMIRQDGVDQMAKYGKMYIGFAVVSGCASMILAIVTMLSNSLATAGNSMFGSGSPFALLWAGLSPAIAAVILHFVFKKVLKMPSPMTPSGALGWASAAGGGALGGALGAGLVNRMQNRATGAIRSGAKNAASATGRGALGAVSGGRLGNKDGQGRFGRMAPAGASGAGTGGGHAIGGGGGGGNRGALGAGSSKGLDSSALAPAEQQPGLTIGRNGKPTLSSRLANASGKALEKLNQDPDSKVSKVLTSEKTWKVAGTVGKMAVGGLLTGGVGAIAGANHGIYRELQQQRTEKRDGMRQQELKKLTDTAVQKKELVSHAQRNLESAKKKADKIDGTKSADKKQAALTEAQSALANLKATEQEWQSASNAAREYHENPKKVENARKRAAADSVRGISAQNLNADKALKSLER